MSNTSAFTKVPVKVPNRNGFDLSHETLGTATVGTLVPVLVDEIFPNDKFSLGVTSEVELPPMATNFYGRVDICFEAFFVPYRIIYGGWKKFYSQKGGDNINLPTLAIDSQYYQPAHCLMNYLGWIFPELGEESDEIQEGMSILAPVAYAKIYDDWYRDSRLQKSLFSDDPSDLSDYGLSTFITQDFAGKEFGPVGEGYDYNYLLADGSSVLDTRQRNYAKDYFTASTTDPQNGLASQVRFVVDSLVDFQDEETELPSEGDPIGEGGFTIASLRAANALQRFLEVHNISGDRYPDRVLADWGCLPSDAITDRAIFLGRQKANVICHSVVSGISQEPNQDDPDFQMSRNPFAYNAGSVAGRASAFVQGHLGSFASQEHGFLMVLMSLVPHTYYGSGCRRYLQAESFRKSLADFPNAILAGIGDQPIDKSEVTGYIWPSLHDDLTTFGYTQRFAEVKFIPDTVHGLLADGRSLSSFALKRTFISDAEISSSFIEIPTNAMDDVTSVVASLSTFGYKYDVGFSYKKSTCLPAYSIPTLESDQDTHTIMVDNGGKRL